MKDNEFKHSSLYNFLETVYGSSEIVVFALFLFLKMQMPLTEVLPHHIKHEVCLDRPAYRSSRKPKAVRAYCFVHESKYLLVQCVQAVNAIGELVKLFETVGGTVSEYRYADEYPCKEFEDAVLIKFQEIRCARIAKIKLDEYNFYGASLHICYVPECESIEDVRQKILERKRLVKCKGNFSKNFWSNPSNKYFYNEEITKNKFLKKSSSGKMKFSKESGDLNCNNNEKEYNSTNKVFSFTTTSDVTKVLNDEKQNQPQPMYPSMDPTDYLGGARCINVSSDIIDFLSHREKTLLTDNFNLKKVNLIDLTDFIVNESERSVEAPSTTVYRQKSRKRKRRCFHRLNKSCRLQSPVFESETSEPVIVRDAPKTYRPTRFVPRCLSTKCQVPSRLNEQLILHNNTQKRVLRETASELGESVLKNSFILMNMCGPHPLQPPEQVDSFEISARNIRENMRNILKFCPRQCYTKKNSEVQTKNVSIEN